MSQPHPPSTDVASSRHSSASERAPSPPPSHETQRQPPAASELRAGAHAPRNPALPAGSEVLGPLSAGAADRVFPIRSVISVEPAPAPAPPQPPPERLEGYFYSAASSADAPCQDATPMPPGPAGEDCAGRLGSSPPGLGSRSRSRRGRVAAGSSEASRAAPARLPPRIFSDIVSSMSGESESNSGRASVPPERPVSSAPASSAGSGRRSSDEAAGLVTARFRHVTSDGGHYIITGRDDDGALQRCEDEPIHVPGAIQSFGLLIALQEEADTAKLKVRIASENSKQLIGYSPGQLFALDSFLDILSEEQADNLLDHIDFIRDEDADVATNGPEVFTLSIRPPQARKPLKLWCAMHTSGRNPGLVTCEFELEEDPVNPLVPPSDMMEGPEDTLHSTPTAEELAESTVNSSRPLRVLRSARKRKGEAAAMEVFNIMSQVQEQLAAAPSLELFLKVLVGVVKELTGFHRVMVYQFDQAWNGRVVTELVDPAATKDLFKGLCFPASDIPKQARELYKINRVRLLYDRDQETARLVCRTAEDFATPLDLTHSYLRAMSPVHLQYLRNMAVRSSMSISINAFNELWGLIACHSYGPRGMRVSFPIRKMCRLVGDSASRNIERLSYESRLQARKLINTVPTEHNPSGYIVASSDDLLKLFDADFGLLSIRDETKILGQLEQSQEALAMLEYLRVRKITSVVHSQDISADFPDLRYPPGFSVIAGMLFVPLSVGGNDFIVFFRKGQLKEVKWAGNPYEKLVKEGTEGYLEPRKSFKIWRETVVGKCREWTEEEVETAAVLCLVYGKFIEVWRQKEAAIQNSQLTRLLLANSAHEVRTPLNAIINYLEIALEGSLDQETRENLAKSHSASKSLIYVINDLLDLTKTEEGGQLIKGEVFDLRATLREATDAFAGDARRKGISYEVVEHPDLPTNVIGDQRKVRQAVSNVTANAVQNTAAGGVVVDIYVAAWEVEHVFVEVAVQDSGVGMNNRKLDSLFRDLEQVQSERLTLLGDGDGCRVITEGKEEPRILGLGLAVVARIVRNMRGQLRLKSEEGKGSRFVVQFPFELPESELRRKAAEASPTTPGSPQPESPGEVTLVDRHRARRGSAGHRMARKGSADSVNSRKSLRSLRSASSGHSGKSDVDRLIETIREPHLIDGWSHAERSQTAVSHRPRLEKRFSFGSQPTPPKPARPGGLDEEHGGVAVPEHRRNMHLGPPGQENLAFSGTPLRAIKVPEDPGSPMDELLHARAMAPGEAHEPAPPAGGLPTADHMHVLVAEDDPVNSKIVKKRLEKLGHEVYLTVNGEECASAYGDKPGFFDVVLMDMQMPIVDGLTSTRMIRAFELTHPAYILSARASLNGRVPIVAVSASLVEADRQTYVDAGFDGWILKPISFSRLGELLKGIVDERVREDALYTPGEWEKGGWFHKGQPSIHAVGARLLRGDVETAADSDDPGLGDGGAGRMPAEWRRPSQAQEDGSDPAQEGWPVPELTGAVSPSGHLEP